MFPRIPQSFRIILEPSNQKFQSRACVDQVFDTVGRSIHDGAIVAGLSFQDWWELFEGVLAKVILVVNGPVLRRSEGGQNLLQCLITMVRVISISRLQQPFKQSFIQGLATAQRHLAIV